MIQNTANSKINPPEPLGLKHDLSNFECESESLNKWLKETSLKAESNTARTFVVTVENQVIGYYCLATSSIERKVAISSVKQNTPNPIPCILIGRLAVDHRWTKQGIGSGLLRDACLRILDVASIVGVRAILVHAGNEKARDFYLRSGFKESPIEPLTLMLPLKDIY